MNSLNSWLRWRRLSVLLYFCALRTISDAQQCLLQAGTKSQRTDILAKQLRAQPVKQSHSTETSERRGGRLKFYVPDATQEKMCSETAFPVDRVTPNRGGLELGVFSEWLWVVLNEDYSKYQASAGLQPLFGELERGIRSLLSIM